MWDMGRLSQLGAKVNDFLKTFFFIRQAPLGKISETLILALEANTTQIAFFEDFRTLRINSRLRHLK